MFGMALVAKGKKIYINIGAVKLKEMNPNAIINKINNKTLYIYLYLYIYIHIYQKKRVW